MAARPAESGIRAIFDRAAELEGSGRSIVHLEIGRPHRSSPEPAREAAEAALRRGDVHYTASRGTGELRSAIAGSLSKRGVDRDPDTELVVTAGGSEALLASLMATLQPGDEALVPTPAWPHYAGQLALAGARCVEIPCRAVDGFRPDPERLEAAITPRTRLVVVSSPSNPSGAVFGDDALAAIAELCERHDLIALSDEIYERFVYDGEHVSIGSLPGMRPRTIVANSFSKAYAMTGWRVGWVEAPAALATAINAVHQHLSVCAASFAQAGAAAALGQAERFVAELVDEYHERGRQLSAGLERIDALETVPLAGAFYAFPRVATGESGTALATRLLEQAGVAAVPGAVFGDGFENHIRISYAVEQSELAEGLERVREALA